MMNMEYCRFENTNMALEECLDAIENETPLSNRELKACKTMFNRFIEFLTDEDIIQDEDGMDSRLEEFFEKIK